MKTIYPPSNYTLRRGFTLVEIMFVILLIGLLLAIAIPNFVAARKQTRKKACINNLRKIDWAKDAWMMDNNKDRDVVITEDNIFPSSGLGYLRAKPVCDAGGVYTIGNGEEDPTCSLSADGHNLAGN